MGAGERWVLVQLETFGRADSHILGISVRLFFHTQCQHSFFNLLPLLFLSYLFLSEYLLVCSLIKMLKRAGRAHGYTMGSIMPPQKPSRQAESSASITQSSDSLWGGLCFPAQDPVRIFHKTPGHLTDLLGCCQGTDAQFGPAQVDFFWERWIF
jgi:hypothetical protein